MEIMVAFLGNKKKNDNSNRISSIKSIHSKENSFNRLNFSNSGNNKNDKINININKIRKESIKSVNDIKGINNIKDTRSIINTPKVIDNGVKRGIYASVVSNPNISLKNSKSKIDKQKAITGIEEILYIRDKQKNNVKFKNIKENSTFRKKVENSDIKASNLINFMLVAVPLLAILFANSTIANQILINFSTNFRQAEDINFEVTDLVKTYGLYNTDNYIINEQVEQKIEKAEVVEKEKLEPVIITSNEEIIDKEAEIEDVAAFLGNDTINVQITENSSSIQRVTIGNTKILNYSSKRDIDYAGLINSDVILTKKSDKILLYNTHTSETYTNSEGYQFSYTGTMRTTDAEYNMLAIAKKFSENLNLKGFTSVHDTTPHDYGTYTSAYAKSRITVKSALETMSGAGIIIDVHRDASSDLSYRPVANIKGVQVAQLMFVVGVGSSSSPNNNWQDNLKLALKLQQMADKVYPGLFRPMIIRNSVYNQDLNKYALLIEFGATGNTIEEVKLSTRCMTNLLNIMYKD